ncbi:MAG TPA: GAF domain-containing protein [Terriglobales bacterium]|nr:GAF domain-containing protein [Terriglobales bacterium]
MADFSKRIEKAEKYLQKGKTESALEEYLGILEDDPNQDGVRSSAADLCLQLNRAGDATKLLSVLFERQAGIGDVSKANITYKKLLKATTPTPEQSLRYGQLMEKTSKKDALDAYEAAVGSFTSAGRKQDALAALKRVVALDPKVENYRREGELATELFDIKAAAEAFFQAGELEAKAGDGNPGAWYARAFTTDPTLPHAALAHGKTLLAKGDAKGAVQAVEALATGAAASPELREAYCRGLLASGRPLDAEPYVWELLDKDPAQADEVGRMIAELIKAEQMEKALAAAHRLEENQTKHDRRREYVNLIKEVTDKQAPSVEFLEYLVEVYNANNREQDYCATLIKLFQLYYAAGNFIKAADSLDAAAEVDAYEPGHQKRLEMLRGKIDSSRFNAVANRFAGAVKVDEDKAGAPAGGMESETTVLDDLMLQAEIFLQYSMRSKAVERLERIQKLFPREEDKNEKLRSLYMNAGLLPKYPSGVGAVAPAVPAAPASGAPPPGLAPAVPGSYAAAPSANDAAVDNIARVTEITRNIYRQGNVKSVLFTAVNEVGRHWSASRCVAGLCTPGKPPSAALEYCAPGVKQSDVMAIVKLIGTLQALAVARGPVLIPNAPGNPDLAGVQQFIEALTIQSILAVPLMDGDEHAGVLILEQCYTPRDWRQTDVFVLKTIADQMVLAVNNSRLRSLVKTLAVTDEKSGLLRRASYLDVLLSEVKRSIQQTSTACVMLLQFAKAGPLVKEVGEPAVESMMTQIGQVITSHIRQNDVAVRYDLTTIALVLSDTNEKNAFFVVDKLRKALAGVRLAGSDKPLPITTGIAELVIRSNFDPIDVVTEVINRVERALDAARAEGGDKANALAAKLEPVPA